MRHDVIDRRTENCLHQSADMDDGQAYADGEVVLRLPNLVLPLRHVGRPGDGTCPETSL